MKKGLIIIPTYNEIENIERIIRSVFILYKEGMDILIIDDSSPDGTTEVVENLIKRYPNKLHLVKRPGKMGLGTAYVAGFKWALEYDYDLVFEMDADFSHDPKDLKQLKQACIKQNADIAIGSRYKSGVNVVNWPMGRVLMSYFASVYVRFITRMKIRDTTAGFVCYTRKVLETIDLDKIKFMGYAFQIEMKFAAWKLGFNIVEIPIVFVDRQRGTSKMSGGIFNEAFWGVIIIKTRSWFKNYKKK